MNNDLKIIIFQSPPPKSPFAPNYAWVMGETFIPNINFDKIKNFILEKEIEILNSTLPVDNVYSVDGYTGLGPNSLTSRYSRFNVFNWKNSDIQTIRKEIHKQYLNFIKTVEVKRSKVWIKCWANVLRNGEKINAHSHNVSEYCYLGGHLCISTENTKTCYINIINQLNNPEVYESDNLPGKLTLFQNCIPHYTTEHTSDNERITIAFDLVLDELYQHYDETMKKNLVLFDDPSLPEEYFYENE
jgi:hypothetical protein